MRSAQKVEDSQTIDQFRPPNLGTADTTRELNEVANENAPRTVQRERHLNSLAPGYSINVHEQNQNNASVTHEADGKHFQTQLDMRKSESPIIAESVHTDTSAISVRQGNNIYIFGQQENKHNVTVTHTTHLQKQSEVGQQPSSKETALYHPDPGVIRLSPGDHTYSLTKKENKHKVPSVHKADDGSHLHIQTDVRSPQSPIKTGLDNKNSGVTGLHQRDQIDIPEQQVTNIQGVKGNSPSSKITRKKKPAPRASIFSLLNHMYFQGHHRNKQNVPVNHKADARIFHTQPETGQTHNTSTNGLNPIDTSLMGLQPNDHIGLHSQNSIRHNVSVIHQPDGAYLHIQTYLRIPSNPIKTRFGQIDLGTIGLSPEHHIDFSVQYSNAHVHSNVLNRPDPIKTGLNLTDNGVKSVPSNHPEFRKQNENKHNTSVIHQGLGGHLSIQPHIVTPSSPITTEFDQTKPGVIKLQTVDHMHFPRKDRKKYIVPVSRTVDEGHLHTQPDMGRISSSVIAGLDQTNLGVIRLQSGENMEFYREYGKQNKISTIDKAYGEQLHLQSDVGQQHGSSQGDPRVTELQRGDYSVFPWQQADKQKVSVSHKDVDGGLSHIQPDLRQSPGPNGLDQMHPGAISLKPGDKIDLSRQIGNKKEVPFVHKNSLIQPAAEKASPVITASVQMDSSITGLPLVDHTDFLGQYKNRDVQNKLGKTPSTIMSEFYQTDPGVTRLSIGHNDDFSRQEGKRNQVTQNVDGGGGYLHIQSDVLQLPGLKTAGLVQTHPDVHRLPPPNHTKLSRQDRNEYMQPDLKTPADPTRLNQTDIGVIRIPSGDFPRHNGNKHNVDFIHKANAGHLHIKPDVEQPHNSITGLDQADPVVRNLQPEYNIQWPHNHTDGGYLHIQPDVAQHPISETNGLNQKDPGIISLPPVDTSAFPEHYEIKHVKSNVGRLQNIKRKGIYQTNPGVISLSTGENIDLSRQDGKKHEAIVIQKGEGEHLHTATVVRKPYYTQRAVMNQTDHGVISLQSEDHIDIPGQNRNKIPVSHKIDGGHLNDQPDAGQPSSPIGPGLNKAELSDIKVHPGDQTGASASHAFNYRGQGLHKPGEGRLHTQPSMQNSPGSILTLLDQMNPGVIHLQPADRINFISQHGNKHTVSVIHKTDGEHLHMQSAAEKSQNETIHGLDQIDPGVISLSSGEHSGLQKQYGNNLRDHVVYKEGAWHVHIQPDVSPLTTLDQSHSGRSLKPTDHNNFPRKAGHEANETYSNTNSDSQNRLLQVDHTDFPGHHRSKYVGNPPYTMATELDQLDPGVIRLSSEERVDFFRKDGNTHKLSVTNKAYKEHLNIKLDVKQSKSPITTAFDHKDPGINRLQPQEHINIPKQHGRKPKLSAFNTADVERLHIKLDVRNPPSPTITALDQTDPGIIRLQQIDHTDLPRQQENKHEVPAIHKIDGGHVKIGQGTVQPPSPLITLLTQTDPGIMRLPPVNSTDFLKQQVNKHEHSVFYNANGRHVQAEQGTGQPSSPLGNGLAQTDPGVIRLPLVDQTDFPRHGNKKEEVSAIHKANGGHRQMGQDRGQSPSPSITELTQTDPGVIRLPSVYQNDFSRLQRHKHENPLIHNTVGRHVKIEQGIGQPHGPLVTGLAQTDPGVIRLEPIDLSDFPRQQSNKHVPFIQKTEGGHVKIEQGIGQQHSPLVTELAQTDPGVIRLEPVDLGDFPRQQSNQSEIPVNRKTDGGHVQTEQGMREPSSPLVPELAETDHGVIRLQPVYHNDFSRQQGNKYEVPVIRKTDGIQIEKGIGQSSGPTVNELAQTEPGVIRLQPVDHIDLSMTQSNKHEATVIHKTDGGHVQREQGIEQPSSPLATDLAKMNPGVIRLHPDFHRQQRNKHESPVFHPADGEHVQIQQVTGQTPSPTVTKMNQMDHGVSNVHREYHTDFSRQYGNKHKFPLFHEANGGSLHIQTDVEKPPSPVITSSRHRDHGLEHLPSIFPGQDKFGRENASLPERKHSVHQTRQYVPQNAHIPSQSRMTHAGIPGKLLNVPNVHRSIPGELPNFLNVHKSVPGESRNIPDAHRSLPGELLNFPDGHGSIPEDLLNVPGVHRSVPGELLNFPDVHESDPGELLNVPGFLAPFLETY